MSRFFGVTLMFRLAQAGDLGCHRHRIDHYAVADDAHFPRAQDAGGNEVQDVLFATHDDRVPGIVAACERTTMSAFSVSKSMILPLPSSPHWAPTRIVFAMK